MVKFKIPKVARTGTDQPPPIEIRDWRDTWLEGLIQMEPYALESIKEQAKRWPRNASSMGAAEALRTWKKEGNDMNQKVTRTPPAPQQLPRGWTEEIPVHGASKRDTIKDTKGK